MSFPLKKRQEILTYILQEIKSKNPSPAAAASKKFNISRQTAYKYLSILKDEGNVIVNREGSRNIYSLSCKKTRFSFPIAGLEEDVVWREKIFPLLNDLPQNIITACSYGFTEMLNNAIDHSDSLDVLVCYEEDSLSVEFMIIDNGIGIFQKIQKSLGLEDQKHALLELAKGKLTTDPKRHSGEGIFFTSRTFDGFYIRSANLQFLSGRKNGPDYLIENPGINEKGTCVIMTIEKDSDVVLKDIFDSFTAKNDDSFGFTKTHIPVRLAECEGVALVSRSQAKRLIRRFDRFMEVVLDFKGVDEIGQAFADELFRVFALDHPNVELFPINMSDDVRKMVLRANMNSVFYNALNPES